MALWIKFHTTAIESSFLFLVLGISLTILVVSSVLQTLKTHGITSPMLCTLTGALLQFSINLPRETVLHLGGELARIILAIQLASLALDIPPGYTHKTWRPLLGLLFPVMIGSWLLAAMLLWVFTQVDLLKVPHFDLPLCLVLGAALAPTDSVLISTLVRGRFAQSTVPRRLRELLSAESGWNDGVAFPLVVLGLIIARKELDPVSLLVSWLVETILIDVLVASLVSALIGYLLARMLHASVERGLTEHDHQLASTGR